MKPEDRRQTDEIRILVVDDDQDLLQLLGILVSSLGYHCTVAHNGLAALNALRNDEFSIVLTDIIMPEMDGLELLSRIKKYMPCIDVIIMTGYAGKYNARDAIQAGAADFIVKPFTRDELKAKLNLIVQARRRRYAGGQHTRAMEIDGDNHDASLASGLI